MQIGKNHKPIIPASERKPHVKCAEPYEEIQLDFGGPIQSEKDQEIHSPHVLIVFQNNHLLKSLIKPMHLKL